jgi:hypothetical protein
MTRMLRLLAVVLPLLGAVACDDDCGGSEACSARRELPAAPTSVPTTPVPPPIVTNRFEFRVLGGADNAVDIRYGTTQEGTTILASQVPWFVSHQTTQSASFLTLAARATAMNDDAEPITLHVQIIVNGQLFREASAVGLTPAVSVSGLFTAP